LGLHRLHQAGAFFVTPTKKGLKMTWIKSSSVDWASGLRSDQTVHLATEEGRAHYPDALRRVRFKNRTSGRLLEFLANNFDLPAITITGPYVLRWRMELVLRGNKRHFRSKTLQGTSQFSN